MNELLPCPFCGGPNIERVMLGIECADCGARVPDDLTWNRRALLRETGTPEAAMDELNAALLRAPDLPVAGVRIAAPPAAVPGIPAAQRYLWLRERLQSITAPRSPSSTGVIAA